jgi:hypothetical protein
VALLLVGGGLLPVAELLGNDDDMCRRDEDNNYDEFCNDFQRNDQCVHTIPLWRIAIDMDKTWWRRICL